MKRIILCTFAFLSMIFSASAQDSEIYKLRTTMENSFPVKGGTDIERFYIALMRGSNEYFTLNNINSVKDDEEGSYEVDKKNGYLRHVVEGDGRMEIQCCCWKRDDGRYLVGFYYDSHDNVPDKNNNFYTKHESFVQFYTYNELTKTLDPLRDPWDEELYGKTHLIVKMPQQGKNINYRWGKEDDKGAWSTFTWNGYDFRKKPAAATTIREGKHLLSVQWIEDVNYGSCQIKRTGKAGEYTITGTHYNKAKTDWLKIDGKITVVNSKRLRFNGTIKTRINHIANGKEQIRRGDFDFLSTGSRKYWRLQQMYNPEDICVDYVDIYFN